MSGYQAPVEDLQFVLEALADLPGIARLPGLEEATPDLVRAVLSEAGRLASEVLAPLTIFGRKRCCCSGLPWRSSASTAPWVSIGHRAKAMLAPFQISPVAAATSSGSPWPPQATGSATPFQPDSTNSR